MSPFNDLGRLCIISTPTGTVPKAAFPYQTSPVGAERYTERDSAYLLGFARVLALGLLGFVGLLSLCVGAVVLFRGHVLQASKAGTFERAAASRRARASISNDGTRPNALLPEVSGALARLEIPRLGFSARVREGTALEVLKNAVGHISGTALPGEPGNIGLTGHRDTFFRSLDGLQTGDLIRLTTPDRTQDYRVESVRVVAADRANLLAFGAGRPALTLITRYAFGSVGPSARQLVVLSRPAL